MMTDERRDAREKYAAIGNAFLSRVAQRLNTIRPEELDPADLARWTDIALKLSQAGAKRDACHTPRTQQPEEEEQ